MIQIKKLDKDKIPQIAKIHKQCLSNGFIASFPLGFLEKYYDTLFESKDVFTYIAVDDQKVLGFITATYNVKALPKILITHLWKEVIILIKNPLFLVKIFQLSLHPSLRDEKSSCEIPSIAVVPSARRHGLGKKLISAAKLEFKGKGFKKFQLSLRDSMQEANTFYQRLGLKKVKSAKFLGETINFWQGGLF
ncbi:MAG: GNAT family N-acetyltransferase [Patescibacteria group bacterium]